MITKKLINYKVKYNQTLKDTIRVLNKGGIGFCFCVNKFDDVIGIFTDGDFRRVILNGKNLNTLIGKIINKNFDYLKKNHTKKQIENVFAKNKARHIPVLENKKLIGIIVFDDYEKIITKKNLTNFNDIIAVIMSGGKGKRLDPFTRILPKPLIPIGNNPIIKLIQKEFNEYGIYKFIISINEKSDIIKSYFKSIKDKSEVTFLEEKKPLGTAGSLSELKSSIKNTFFVSNCDIIIKDNYKDIFNFHKKNKYQLTIVGSAQQHSISYGVCEINKKGKLKQIKEKPNLDLIINTGFYVLEPNILKLIPENTFFNMTDLIKLCLNKKYNIGVFPVNEGSWIDIGHWSEYNKSLEKLNFKL